MASEEERVLPLHRRCRPSSFSNYVGNKKMLESARSALNGGGMQVCMVEGVSGGGKTTFARILANEVRCDNRDSVRGACGVCDSCVAMREYILTGDCDVVDGVTEVDVTIKANKNELEAILEDASYADFDGKVKVYIFDECHMALPAAQQLFLKFTEEPPANILFIFCTTDPQRMLPTLLGRFQYRFKVIKPDIEELVDYLSLVCSQEGVCSDRKGLRLIAVRSEMTIRKSLITLESIITARKSVTLKDVEEVLVAVSDEYFYKLLSYLKARDKFKYYALIQTIKENFDLGNFIDDLITFITRALPIHNGVHLAGVTSVELKSIKKLMQNFDDRFLVEFLDELLLLKSDTESRLLRLLRLIYIHDRRSSFEAESVFTSTDAESAVTSARAETRESTRASDARLYAELDASFYALDTAHVVSDADLSAMLGGDSLLDLDPESVLDAFR